MARDTLAPSTSLESLIYMIPFAPCRWTLLASLICLPAFAETVVPLQGQTQQQIQQDIANCQAQAGSTTSSTTSTPSGGRVRGAATGAVAGAAR